MIFYMHAVCTSVHIISLYVHTNVKGYILQITYQINMHLYVYTHTQIQHKIKCVYSEASLFFCIK